MPWPCKEGLKTTFKGEEGKLAKRGGIGEIRPGLSVIPLGANQD